MKNNKLSIMILAAAVLTITQTANAQSKLVVKNLENHAQFTEEEMGLLNDVVRSVFEELPGIQVVAKDCDDCADYLVTGKITKFDQEYIGSLKIKTTKTDQLIKNVITDGESEKTEMVASIKKAAVQLSEKLDEITKVKPKPKVIKNVQEPSQPKPPTKSISIETDPPGAAIYIGKSKIRKGDYMGTTPIAGDLKIGTYWVFAKNNKNQSGKTKLIIENPRSPQNLKLKLSKKKFYTTMGHGFFWTGAAIGGTSAIFMKDGPSAGGISLVSVGGTALITGIVFWVLAVREKRGE